MPREIQQLLLKTKYTAQCLAPLLAQKQPITSHTLT